MASRIQGITVEIGGDTTKLTTALKGVNSEIRNTQSQLRDVEKMLKLDPSNTELLSQKQRLLNEEVQATKEKLEELKRASEQENAALEQGTITQSQYDALQREIIATEQALEDLEEQAEQSAVALQKISVTGTKMQDVGSKVEGVGKSLLPVTAALTGVGAAGLKVATDFEKAMSGVQAITGATGEDFEKLRETAIDLGATTSFSSGEVAEAMSEMAKAGWSTTQIIDGMAGVLDATAASGESLGTVSTIVADAITGFGLSAKDSARVADLMTQAANSGTIGVSDLGESYKYVAPLAQSMGLSIEDVTTALSAMSMAGIKGSQAGTSLRTVLANMAKQSDTVATAMEDLGIEIANADGSFKSLDEIMTIMRTSFSGLTDDQKAYYATALAGKEGMSGLISLLNLTQEEYDELSSSMNNCTGVAGETAAVMQDNLQSKVEQLGGALESLAIKLSEYVIPFLTGLVEKITAAVDAFTNMNPMLANPIFLIIAAITALVAAFIYLWNTNEDFRQFWINLWENIKEVAISVWNAIKEFFTAAWEAISSVAQTIWNGIKNFFSALWEGIKMIFTTVLTVISTIVTTYFNIYKTIITTVFNAIKTVITTVLNAIKTVITTVWNTIKTVFTTVLNTIKSVVSGAFNSMWINNTVSKIVDSIKTGFNNAVSFVKNLASSAFQWGADIIQGIVNGIKSCIGKVKDAVTNVAETIRSFLHFSVPDEGPLTDYESWMPDFMSGLAKGIEQSKSMVAKAVDGVASNMVITPQMAMAGYGAEMSAKVPTSTDSISGITTAITERLYEYNGDFKPAIQAAKYLKEIGEEGKCEYESLDELKSVVERKHLYDWFDKYFVNRQRYIYQAVKRNTLFCAWLLKGARLLCLPVYTSKRILDCVYIGHVKKEIIVSFLKNEGYLFDVCEYLLEGKEFQDWSGEIYIFKNLFCLSSTRSDTKKYVAIENISDEYGGALRVRKYAGPHRRIDEELDIICLYNRGTMEDPMRLLDCSDSVKQHCRVRFASYEQFLGLED